MKAKIKCLVEIEVESIIEVSEREFESLSEYNHITPRDKEEFTLLSEKVVIRQGVDTPDYFSNISIEKHEV